MWPWTPPPFDQIGGVVDKDLAKTRADLEELVHIAAGLYGIAWALLRNPSLAQDSNFMALVQNRVDGVKEDGWESVYRFFP